MYSIDWAKIFSRSTCASSGAVVSEGEQSPVVGLPPRFRRWLPVVSRTVWALGFTSLLTDISSEMVVSILPVYLVLYLGISPLAFGVVDGIYQGVAALIRISGGVLADRWRMHKAVAVLGYGLSAACRLLIFAAGSAWGMISVIIALDRIGKGIRTAPRDALISKRSLTSKLATAFGVHRALDAVGALLGPLFAFALLAMMPNAFENNSRKQKKIARESLEVFAPMADKLGMGRVRMQIEELAFSFLDPIEYKKMKILIFVFFGSTNANNFALTEDNKLMFIPLFFLAVCSIFIGYIFSDIMIGSGTFMVNYSFFI